MRDNYQRLSDDTRRMFLGRAAQSLLGVSVLQGLSSRVSAASTPGAAKRLVYVFLEGGLSHLDTFDPKPGAEEQGETKPIKTKVAGISVAEHLPKLAKIADQLAIVRSLTTETGAHEQGRYLMRTSYKMIASTRHPSLGAWLQKYKGKGSRDLPGSVVVGGGARHPGPGFLGATFAPAPVGNPATGLENTKPPAYVSDSLFDKRMRLATRFDRGFQQRYDSLDVKSYVDFYREAVALLKSSGLEAFDISKEPAAAREKYGAHRSGQGCLLARRLLEAGVNCVEVALGGWDNHRDIFSEIPTPAGALDQALAALLGDLAERGMLQDTLVVVATEFGRTPKVNQNAGRDHHPGVFSGLLAGGGIQGGQVYGASDKRGHAVATGGVYPADFNATIAKALGLPLDQPATSPQGRPFTVANQGTPLEL